MESDTVQTGKTTLSWAKRNNLLMKMQRSRQERCRDGVEVEHRQCFAHQLCSVQLKTTPLLKKFVVNEREKSLYRFVNERL